MNQLADELRDHVAACFTGIWIISHEHADAVMEIARLSRENEWSMATWDISCGLVNGGANPSEGEFEPTDPLSVLKSFGSQGSADQPSLIVLKNLHRFLGNAEIVQTLAEQIQLGKQNRTFFVVLAPKSEIPIELEKLFVVLEHSLPCRDQLAQIAREIGQGEELPGEEAMEQLLTAASGLTRVEAENAFALSIVRHGSINARTVQHYKCQTLKKSGLLELHESPVGFGQLGGMSAVKGFCVRALQSRSERARPRGILLLGIPGTGKSAFAKALGREVGRPTIIMDVGRLMGGLVGQTEANVRQALAVVDALAPAILFIDEVEKALGGTTGGGRQDSGVSSRMLGSLLTWLADHQSDIFVVATSNDVSQLPPELTRAERFDAIYFTDLPTSDERQGIWQIWMEHYQIDEGQVLPVDDSWTGSEIKSCCRLAALLGLSLVSAAEHVVPIAATSRESINRLRSWADQRCLSANQPGVFQKGPRSERRRRTSEVGPNPSKN